MKEPRGRDLIRLVVALTIMAGGCSVLSPQEDRTRYFVLMPVAGSSSVAPMGGASQLQTLAVGLGPISIPPYLDRPEVVTRLSDTEFSVSDNDRWGESLETSVSRVLSQDLSSDLPGLQVVPFPWSRKTEIDYRISVDFRRLERTADGRADVQAVWTVRSGADNKLVQNGTTTASQSAGSDQRSASAALSEGIAQVSRDIAQALQRQAQLRAATQKQTRSRS